MNLRFKVSLIVGIILTIVITPIMFVTFAWYISTSNDAKAATNEIKTVIQGYAGHFSTERKSKGLDEVEIYEKGNEITEITVKPGDLVYYAFIFDIEQSSSLASSYQIDLVLNATSTIGTYHDVAYGNYNSFLSHVGIEENTCHIMQLQRLYDNEKEDYKYVKTSTVYANDYSFNNTEVKSFYTTTNGISASFNLSMPNVTTSPADANNKNYFLVFVPIWYMDTDELQNNELNCNIKISSTVIIPNNN